MRHVREFFPIDAFVGVRAVAFFFVKFRHVNRTEIARIIKMKHLFAARIAGVNRSHRVHHMVMAIYFVNKDDARFGVFVRRSDDAIPDVGRVNHSRRGRIVRSCSRKDRQFQKRVCRQMSRSSRPVGDKRHNRFRLPDRKPSDSICRRQIRSETILYYQPHS